MIIKFIFMMNMYLRSYSKPSRNETCAVKGHTFFDVLDEPVPKLRLFRLSLIFFQRFLHSSAIIKPPLLFYFIYINMNMCIILNTITS